MKKVLIAMAACLFASLLFFAADRAASERKAQPPESLEEILARANSGGGLTVLDMRAYPRNSGEHVASAEESFLCLWSSYSAVPDPHTQTCFVEVETIDQLCNPVAGNLTTATAFYRASAKKAGDIFYGPGSLTWGYLPGLPTGWCWTLVVYFQMTGVPYLPDEYWFDRASAYRHPPYQPLQGYCGWPLATMPPDPFLVHCP
jgi:hypothetical protein